MKYPIKYHHSGSLIINDANIVREAPQWLEMFNVYDLIINLRESLWGTSMIEHELFNLHRLLPQSALPLNQWNQSEIDFTIQHTFDKQIYRITKK